MKVFRARGVVVKVLGTRRGKRNDLGLGKLPRGGKMRKKEEFEKKWIHPDAENAFTDKLDKVSIN